MNVGDLARLLIVGISEKCRACCLWSGFNCDKKATPRKHSTEKYVWSKNPFNKTLHHSTLPDDRTHQSIKCGGKNQNHGPSPSSVTQFTNLEFFFGTPASRPFPLRLCVLSTYHLYINASAAASSGGRLKFSAMLKRRQLARDCKSQWQNE